MLFGLVEVVVGGGGVGGGRVVGMGVVDIGREEGGRGVGDGEWGVKEDVDVDMGEVIGDVLNVLE